MFKKVIAAVVAFAIATAMLFAVESSDVRELNAVVTESSNGVVVMDVDMPNGQVHEWAFYGDGYAVGDNVIASIDLYDDIIVDVEQA